MRKARAALIVLLIGLVALSACSPSRVAQGNFNEPLQIALTTYGECPKAPCLKVELTEIPSLSFVKSEDVREKIVLQLEKELFDPPIDESDALTKREFLGELSDYFNDQIKQRKKADGESLSEIQYSLKRTVELVFFNEKVGSFRVMSSGYLGGAHGFDSETLITFDVTSGNQLKLSDLIAPHSQTVLSSISEVEMRRVKNLPPGTSLSMAGFTFPEDQEFFNFKNFVLSERGITIHFNPYDIAPYSLGPTTVILPPDGVLPLFKDGTILQR